MARILLGWELGAGTGHSVSLKAIAAELRARGHDLVFAAQQVGVAGAGEEVWQAPLWPGQITSAARRATVTPATMGDILAVLGLGDPAALAGMIAAWDRIVATVRPDIVVAEFAPGLMLAARGRWPIVALGTGFALPTTQHDRLPSLTGEPTVMDEGVLVQRINAALTQAGRRTITALPQIFEADRRVIACFRELDPYREWRIEPHGAPSLAGPVEVEASSGEEIFCYINGARPADAFWQGLVDAGLKTRIYMPALESADIGILAGAGLIVERALAPVADIVRRSRIVVSQGGMGLASTMLIAGVPHLVIPPDIEKKMIAASLVALGTGARLDYADVTRERMRAVLRASWESEALQAAARGVAPGFRARMTCDAAGEAVDAIESLLA